MCLGHFLYCLPEWQAVIDYSGGPIKSTLAAIRIAEIQFDAHGSKLLSLLKYIVLPDRN